MIIYSSSPHNGFNLKTAGRTTDVCEGGGTGRRARLRCVWFILGGSNPLLRTKDQNTLCSGFFVVRRRGFEQHGHAVGGGSKQPSGLFTSVWVLESQERLPGEIGESCGK